ncbi:MAG TPA: hypothetical protein PKO15_08595 [Fibrobacteria bacterium]|nr:hypothetical protein [Fibrobacteria bacterium]
MTRSFLHIVGSLALCLGLWSCMPTNDPPRFHDVGLTGTFSTKDTALGFKGAITAPAGSVHLDFKVYSEASEKTERFRLDGAAPVATTTTWELAKDTRLRLVNRSADVGSYTLVLIAVDGDGISDSLRIPFSIASSSPHYLEWAPLEVFLSLGSASGLSLDIGQVVFADSPEAKDATFFLSYQHSTSDLSGFSWLALVPPALLNPPLANAAEARNDTRFFTSSTMDKSTTPEQVSELLASKAPLDEMAGLTLRHTVYFTTGSGLIGRFVVDSLYVNQEAGIVRLVGAYSKPI